MASTASYDGLYQLLLDELNGHQLLTENQSEFLREFKTWTDNGHKLVARINAGHVNPAEVNDLLAKHQAARPRRKPGRPKSAVKLKHAKQQLTKHLIELGIQHASKDPVVHIKEITQKIIRA
jgi:hypothetical protein